jgi:hypothetical protein
VRTGRNLATTRAVRLRLGHTRVVSMIEGEVEVLDIDALPQERGDRFVAHTGFDPCALATPYRWFRISPRRIHARAPRRSDDERAAGNPRVEERPQRPQASVGTNAGGGHQGLGRGQCSPRS